MVYNSPPHVAKSLAQPVLRACVDRAGFQPGCFVPRELKAQAVHPTKEHKPEAKPEKPKEVVKRAEAVTDNDAKTEATETAAAKTDKPATEGQIYDG